MTDATVNGEHLALQINTLEMTDKELAVHYENIKALFAAYEAKKKEVAAELDRRRRIVYQLPVLKIVLDDSNALQIKQVHRNQDKVDFVKLETSYIEAYNECVTHGGYDYTDIRRVRP